MTGGFKCFLFLPEAGSNVFEVALVIAAVEALVGGGLLQRAKMLDIGSNLDIVEIVFVDS